MRKTVFLKRLLSVATASMLLASACSTLFTASAETASDTETAIQTYQLLDTENYKAGWNTDGVAQNNLMTDVVSGKTLNRVSANYDPSGEVRLYIDCKTPDEAGFSLNAIHSVAYYFKNDAGKELTVNFQNFTDKPIEGGWLTAFGRLMNCTVYLVPSDGKLVKATASDIYGQVKIPEGFEGYVVYDTDTRLKEASGNAYDYDLLTGEYTFGSAMAFTVPNGILKGGDVFYYGEISASTGTAKEFISSVNSAAVYRYPLVTGVSWGLDNVTVDETEPDNKIFTGNMPTGRNESGFDQFGFFNKNIKADYGTDPSEITACSFYVKNPGGHGDVKLRLGNYSNWKFFVWTWWDYYDINTGSFTRDYGEVITVPEGFEGYVVFDVRQTAEGNPNSIYADIFNGDTLWFHEGQDASVGGLKISIGSVTAWTGNYQNVKQALVEKSNVLSAPMQDWRGKTIEVSGVSPDGNCRKYKAAEGKNEWYPMYFDSNNTQLGDYAFLNDFVSKNEAVAVWFKNTSAKPLALNMFDEADGWTDITPSYRLFDIVNQTITGVESGSITVPAGFEGYIFVLLDSTNTKKDGITKTWKQRVAEGGYMKTPAFNAGLSNLQVGESYYIGNLTYVKSVDEFIESRLEVTLEGDANKDGSADILDLVRLKKNAAGISEATVYVPNISYGGNNDTTAATTVSNLRKQLLGAEYQKAAVSKEVHDRLLPPAELKKDTVTSANSQVGFSFYHLSVGDWNKVYGTEKAESEFINYYPGNDISDVRTAKERDSAAWIGVWGAYFNDADDYENKRANLDKYVNTLKAEKLWNTVAGFEFEEITGATNDDPGKLAQFKELSEYLYTKYPEKRQFAVLAVAEVHQAAAVEKAYQHVTDIAFDWYHPTEIEQMRTLLDEMKTNTGLTNAKYWFLPGAYTESEPSADTAAHALTQLNICYDLLMEQPLSNRGGLYLYNWQTFTLTNGTAYGLDQLLKNENYTAVKAKIFELAASLDGTPEFIEIHKGGKNDNSSGTEDKYLWLNKWESEVWNTIDTAGVQTLSYYFKNNSAVETSAFLWINQAWYNLEGTAYAYDINNGSITAVSGQFKLPAGFEGYICYDLAKCRIKGKNTDVPALDKLNDFTQYFNIIAAGHFTEVRNLSYSKESFETIDAYFKSLLKNVVVNDGTNGNTGWVWTEYNNGTASSSRKYTTVDGVSPDGTALKLSYTEEEVATIKNANWAEGGIDTNFTANRDLLSSATMLSYYVKLDNGNNFDVKFGIRPYRTINAPVTVYNLKTKQLTTYAAGASLDFTEFEGYVMFDLRSAAIGDANTPWTEYAANNDITCFQFDLSANSLVNRSLVIDSVTFSTDYYAQLNAIMAK